MKTAIAIFLLAPAVLLADDASKTAKIEEMIRITKADQIAQQMIDQMTPILKTQMSKVDVPAEQRAAFNQMVEEMTTKMTAMIKEKLSWDKLGPVFMKIYSETYTEEEIEGIVAFYKTPAGQAMLQKMPLLIQKTTAYSQELLGSVLEHELPAMIQEMQRKYGK